MRKAVVTGLILALAAGLAYGYLGQVVRSFSIPGNACGGLARSNGYLYSVNYSQGRIYRLHYDTGSIYNYFAARGGTNTRGLAYAWGGNLWQNQGYTSPYRIYRTSENTGSLRSYYTLPGGHYAHGSAPLATGDGGLNTSRILVSDYDARRVYYMTTTGSVSRSHAVSQQMFDIAYDWRNRLIWGGMNSRRVYGYTTTGSLRASFLKPTGNIYGMTYHGSYLWVAGTTGRIYKIHCPVGVSVAPTSMGKIKATFK
jgi:hypothetical protein